VTVVTKAHETGQETAGGLKSMKKINPFGLGQDVGGRRDREYQEDHIATKKGQSLIIQIPKRITRGAGRGVCKGLAAPSRHVQFARPKADSSPRTNH